MLSSSFFSFFFPLFFFFFHGFITFTGGMEELSPRIALLALPLITRSSRWLLLLFFCRIFD